jgi:hypothetical protein
MHPCVEEPWTGITRSRLFGGVPGWGPAAGSRLMAHGAWTRDRVGHPVVPGEMFDGVGYHYYPDRDDVFLWLDAAALDVLEMVDGDEYRHLLLRRRE